MKKTNKTAPRKPTAPIHWYVLGGPENEQGQVESWVGDAHLMISVFSWGTGLYLFSRIISLEELGAWKLFESDHDLRLMADVMLKRQALKEPGPQE